MVKNVIKGSFSIIKSLEKFSRVIAMSKNVEKMKILDYFMIAHGKECD